ncbi:RING finger protein 151-like isoform X2 [Salvelinus fontinalis]|nr:RING finger protein 151-like isoform X2 [Salvelinus fontinalis]
MGYDLERFVGYVNEGLLCCVCRDVLERPLQAPCEHAYCDACISSWLIHHHSCPEDRLPLDISTLRPLHRYMRNDLSRLQIRCVNSGQGCDAICCLETLHTHQDECPFTFISCSSTGCPVQVERRGLESHLLECEFRSRACPSGCGHTLLSVDQSQHNCVAELRTELELLRAEMLGKVEEGQVSRVVCDVRALLGAERLRRQELAEVELEKRELLETLRSLQPCRGQRNRDEPIRGLYQEDGPISSQHQVEHPTRGLLRAGPTQASTQSLPSALPTPALYPPTSPQPGEVSQKACPRSLTLDCIKSREVTVI